MDNKSETSTKLKANIERKETKDEYFQKKKQEYLRQLYKPQGVDDKLLQYIPEGFHGRRVYGQKSIERCRTLGYEIATNPNTGEKISLAGYNVGYLMLISLDDKMALDAAKVERNKRVQSTNEADIVSDVFDSSSGGKVFTKMK